jgi:hypothetical protein
MNQTTRAKAEPFTRGPARHWDEVKIPAGISELERLTYVPGLIGDAVEWIVRGAIRPNRMMALGVATVVVGTLIGRRTMGPTGSATHLYLIILGPTGFGKDWPPKCGGNLMIGAGQAALLGPHEFASAPGFENRRDPKHAELGGRVCENSIRLATIVAVGRGSMIVDRRDMEWARELAKRSYHAAVGGFDKYMREYYEFPQFCEEVLAKDCPAWRLAFEKGP